MSKRTILDILFPRRCPVCGEIVKPAGGLICPPCFQKLSFVTAPVCKKCGKEIADETMEYCEDCMVHGHAFSSGVALLNYDEIARKSMVKIKYNNKREYLDFYGTVLAARYGSVIRRMHADVIIPVPIHRSRRRKRGFNQAEILAEILGQKLGIPVETELLKRNRRTLPQKELSPADRLKNLMGAFTAAPLPDGKKRILLVDDIYTTGSTLEACAQVLDKAGAEVVYFVVIFMTGGR